MEIHVKESTMIQPAQDTPKHCLRMSVLDLLMPSGRIPCCVFLRWPNDSSKFFEVGIGGFSNMEANNSKRI